MGKRRDISILGPGKVGTALGVLAARAGWTVAAVGARDASRAQSAAERIAGSGNPGVRACTVAEAARRGQLALLTVRDEAIVPLCAELAEAGAFARGAVVAHCCGALDSEVLSPARACGCTVASMHPLQTFPTVRRAIRRLPGAACFCEGDKPAAAAVSDLAEAIGARPVRIEPEAKILYHAGATVACNYLAVLVDAAVSLFESAGIDRSTALAALDPLVRATAENVMQLGPAEALTGPVARGDAATVRRHLAALAATPVRDLYRAAGLRAVDLARRKGTIDETRARELVDALRNE